ncbi:TPA: hypothetical protein N0F65_002397 [Lagenidium giganteum]|uniref:TRUD domain-containing protein n=1 Tax=Lagenidium giganteum TaxID=4803 RepID=A0AAV2YQ72_9STRA|nr:TPA: hypothetical protein N0F65_002397 [Lagenidium giganteum]
MGWTHQAKNDEMTIGSKDECADDDADRRGGRDLRVRDGCASGGGDAPLSHQGRVSGGYVDVVSEYGACWCSCVHHNSRPEDFVVQEIDADNNVVFLDDDEEAQLPSEKQKEAVLVAIQAKRTEKQAKIVFEEPEGGWAQQLVTLIGEAAVDDVRAVASGSAESASFLAPPEFRDRVLRQVSIQRCYPMLDCRVVNKDNGDDATILVTQDPLFVKLVKASMSEENAVRIVEFIRKGSDDPDAKRGLEMVHEDTKDARAALHRLISAKTSCLQTATEDRGGMKKIVAYFSSSYLRKRKRSSPSIYVRFVLRKTNQEHFVAMEKLARTLRVPTSAIGYSGTKDKVAVTYQLLTIPNISPKQLLGVNKQKKECAGLLVGRPEYVSAPLSLGSAAGNRFSISVKLIDGEVDHSLLSKSASAIEASGFINYFGFQRVGLPSFDVRPHHIGELLVAKKFDEAVRKLLAPVPDENEQVIAAKRAFLDDGNVQAALDTMPMSRQAERSILQGLKRHGERSYDRALDSLPFARRLMYIHAYQSYVFNMMASFRIRRYGRQAVEGDLVQDAKGEAVHPLSASAADELNKTSSPLGSVVLPLVGSNVIYPTNEVGDKYREMLREHSTEAGVENARLMKRAYRKLVVRPSKMSCTASDGDKAITMKFDLPSGSFATMCLREVFRVDF